MRTPSLWRAVGVVLVCGVLGCGLDNAARDRRIHGLRHVVLISVDTLRADFLGCYGHPFVQTPNIDSLASEAVLFERHLSVAPTTLSSHTALMTGTYPRTHGTPRNAFTVALSNDMLAERLQEAGFMTAGFIAAFPLHSTFQFHQGFDHWDEPFGWSVRPAPEVNQAVLSWLDDVQPKQLFLFVHYFDVHAPYVNGRPWDEMYLHEELDVGGTMRQIISVKAALEAGDPDAVTASDALMRAYAGGVTFVDHHVGKLLSGLRERGILDNALTILTSDHGEMMAERPDEYWDHGHSLFNETLHTPLIIRLPGARSGGERVRQTVGNIDVMPTILELLDLPEVEEVEGRSLRSLLEGDSSRAAEIVFAEATKPHDAALEEGVRWLNDLRPRAVTTPNWKLIHEPIRQRWRLYAIGEGPAGGTEEIETTAHRATIGELRALLEEWAARPVRREPLRRSDKEILEYLRALGYSE